VTRGVAKRTRTRVSRAVTQRLEKQFAKALREHQSGRVGEAEIHYREILRKQENHTGALYYLALLLNETGRRQEAIECMARAVRARPADAVLQNNYGNFLRDAGRPEEAIRAYREAARIDPGYANAFFNLGLCLQQMGRIEDARTAFETAVALAPRDGHAWDVLGTLLIEQGEAEKALTCFERAVDLERNDPRVAYNHAGCLRTLNRIDESASEYRRAVALKPDYAEANYNLALVEKLRGDESAAEAAFRAALRSNPAHHKAAIGLAGLVGRSGRRLEAADMAHRIRDRLAGPAAGAPDNAEVRVALGDLFFELGHLKEAAVEYRKVIECIPDHAGAHGGLNRTYIQMGRPDDAIEVSRKAIRERPEFADGHCNLGIALRFKGRVDEAMEQYQAAIAIDAEFVEAWNNLGIAFIDIGDTHRGLECYRKALELNPESVGAIYNISRCRKFSDADVDEIDKVEALLDRRSLSAEDRIFVHFALGKMYEDCKRFEQSFVHYRKGNELKRIYSLFDAAKLARWASQFYEIFSREFFRTAPTSGNESERPVFVVGMPRSGTTLVEQILSSHPDVFGADELTRIQELAGEIYRRPGVSEPYPRYMDSLSADDAAWAAGQYEAHVEALAGPEIRVTDKMPVNFLHLGFIYTLFPKARVIHCRRNAMDVCLSNYVQLFAVGHDYSYDLSDTAVYYREYEKLMEHWREVLPLRMAEIDYESLVSDQEEESRRLIEFLGLPWDERCLHFYDTERSVRTASHWQVRQPIYGSSTERWRRFEPYLQDLKRDLGLVETNGGD
jgi:tetratricopeptide (TPR) repeat protein